MSENTQQQVIHNPDENRFELKVDGKLALLEYQLSGNNIIFTHTEVPPALEGRGLANQLAFAALEYAKDQGYKVQPLCPFVKLYIKKHEEYQSITWGFKK